jgi:hypothetical protein
VSGGTRNDGLRRIRALQTIESLHIGRGPRRLPSNRCVTPGRHAEERSEGVELGLDRGGFEVAAGCTCFRGPLAEPVSDVGPGSHQAPYETPWAVPTEIDRILGHTDEDR